MDEMYTLGNWPQGAHELFVELGVLKEIEPSSLVWLWECVDPDWVEPMWLPDAVHGGRIMGFYSCGSEWCGVHVVENDRRRQWAPSLQGITALVQRRLGLGSPWIEDVPGRVRLLGSLAHEGQSRDVFLVQGIYWPDSAAMLDGAKRLASSPHATVLCLGPTPPPEQRPQHWRTVLSLEEIVTMNDGEVVLPLARLFEDQTLPVAPATARPALAEQDLDVLQALAEEPDHSLTMAELIAASGYGKKALRATLARLAQLGYTQRPTGTTRKGVTISAPGIAFLSSPGARRSA